MLRALPEALARAVEHELAGENPRRLKQRARALSERYRAHDAGGRARFLADDADALAYAALVLPQSHAQVAGALSLVPRRVGDWAPKSLLDVGSGPGTALWAVADVWPGLERAVACEVEPAALALGRRLAAESSAAIVRDATWREMDVADEGLPGGRFDLVVLALVLSELEPGERKRLLAAAWRQCDGVLLVVEPGTPAAFAVVREARDQLRAAKAATLAPCPHERDCPLQDDWCHFVERSERPDFQRRVKQASLPWEDAKFSFAAMSRFEPAGRPWARVLRHPQRSKGRVRLRLCAEEGVSEVFVPKSRREAYRRAKGLDWGSAVERRDDLQPSSGGG